MEKIKIGVIGCGNMGKNHIRIISTLQSRYQLLGVFDSDSDRAREISKVYECKAYEDIETLITEATAIVIAVPSGLHKKYFDLCADKGVHTLVEKPLALNAKDAEIMYKTANDKNIILMVGHVERYNPVTEELKNILRDEEIIAMDFQRLSPYDKRIFDADVIKDLMIHDIDVMLSLIEEEPQEIKAMGNIIYSDKYDFMQALLRFKKGIHVSLTASRITETKKRTIEVHTKGAFISIDYIARSIYIYRRTNFKLDVGYRTKYSQENIVEKVFVPIKEPLVNEIKHFADCILNKSEPKTSGKEGFIGLSLCEAIIAAAEMPAQIG